MLLPVTTFSSTPVRFGSSGDPDGLYSEWSQWVDMLRVRLVLCQFGQVVEDCVEVGTRTGAAWAGHPERNLVVVKEVLLEQVPWNPIVICLRFSKER
ncbi:hypothetical protein TIFTF001_007793 [Ficus carica]|uniref:Uncharacterized protein n=1 Tax=Ficus carica TaxID=3494 RepID=A0AA88D170_FICCA|nr:hypothetical protein TIFTF001_007793 [Ficus carica]